MRSVAVADELVASVRADRKWITVGCCGTFDYELHEGHRAFLQFARGQGDELIVFVVADATVQRLKSRKPMYAQSVRMSNVQALPNVGRVVALPGHSCPSDQEVILALDLDIYVFGSDQVSPWNRELERQLTKKGIMSIRCPLRKQFSTTEILRGAGLLTSSPYPLSNQE